MVYSIIQKSQLEGTKRLDAEYYQPEYLIMKNRLLHYGKATPLFELAKIQAGPAYSSDQISDDFEVPLARIGDVTNKNDTADWVKLSLKEFEKFKSAEIKTGDILMTMTGDPPDVGKVNIVYIKQNKKLAFNQRVAKLTVKEDKIDSRFLFAYLSTEFSRFQTERAALGIRQRNLATEDLKNLLVVIPQNYGNITKLIDKYINNLNNSKFLYSQAKNLFFKELNLTNFQPDNSLSSVINLSDIQKANRFDAEYFNSPCNKMLAIINKVKTARLGDLTEMTKGVEPGAEAYLESPQPPLSRGQLKLFIRVSSISKDGVLGKDQKYISEDLYNKYKENYQPQAGEILLTKDASIGVACLVREPLEGIISSGVMRLKLKEKINPEYLTLVLNSMVGRLQAERDAGGSVIAHWKPEQIKNLAVPILPTATQNKIGDLLSQSYQARRQAKELLAEAKLKVEEMIEKK